eukprot:CAMPEP_0177209476 /NCGR_PEP_ID=MMETSP0367-20130122/31040_1 /TAXON_ID=447022 ORGANISM="Scrippsiella hangoei-like, Strain SHHI-4" /NCGR_SAMPLE_ID=MMETSP0367 /ASSEMBLY_ACC=CAM_ASM_000362 /LENGTH=187 /DNA_ID=CAMNT_0018658519 /DNA_START=33 /DNA_END=596 /DNA_ORIENTATION=-
MAYRPGMGVTRDAVDRLRQRRQAEADGSARGGGGGGLELPGVDDSEQASLLLGNGAKKVARCGLCTRPLDELLQMQGLRLAHDAGGSTLDHHETLDAANVAAALGGTTGGLQNVAAGTTENSVGIGREESVRLMSKVESIMQKKRGEKDVREDPDRGKKNKESKKDKVKKASNKKQKGERCQTEETK